MSIEARGERDERRNEVFALESSLEHEGQIGLAFELGGYVKMTGRRVLRLVKRQNGSP